MKKCWSVLTDNMGRCYITGLNVVAIHHVFGGSRKAASEKYGFLVPLHPHCTHMVLTASIWHRTEVLTFSLSRNARPILKSITGAVKSL